MKILVTVKRVVDAYVKIKIKADGSGVDKNQVKMSMNPFDEIALEEAIRKKEQGLASEIVILTIDQDDPADILRHGLALGADRAIFVKVSTAYCGLEIAKIIEKIVIQEDPKLVLMGKQAIDDDSSQVPQMLATLLDWGGVTYASRISINNDNTITVVREISSGLETVKATLPAVISVDLRLNQPRYASLPNIMKARTKEINTINVNDLNINFTSREIIKNIAEPPVRNSGVEVKDVDDLMHKLINEAQVL